MKNRIRKRLAALALSLAMVAGLLPGVALAAPEEEVTLPVELKGNAAKLEGLLTKALTTASLQKQTVTTIKINGAVTTLSKDNWTLLRQYCNPGSGWDKLTTIDLSESSLTSIANLGTPVKAENLVTVRLPASLQTIGNQAFNQSPNLIITALPDRIETIGQSAFANLTKLSLQKLPNNLQTIGPNAFENCTSLALTELPPALTTIGNASFKNCTSLNLTKIPEKLTSIDHYAFYGCTALTELEFPACINKIGSNAFLECSQLSLLRFNSDTPPTIQRDSFNRVAATGDIFYPFGSDYSILQSINTVKDWRFTSFLSTLKVTFNSGDSMQNQIEAALSSQTLTKNAVSTIQVTGNATEISDDDWNALRDCYHDNSEWENLTDLSLSGMTQLTKIAGLDESSSSFRKNMGRLINATLPEQISAIESFAFSDCFNLKLNKLPNSLTTIGNGAFNNCKKLALPALPAEVDHIGERAFSYCGLLELTELPSRLTTIEAYAFSNCAALNLDKLPDSVKHIGNGAFYTCDKLALTVLPAALETIGEDAFGYCPALNLSSLPASVSAIGEKAFRNCRGLKAMDLSGCTNLTAIPNDLFYECVSLTQVTLPDSVVSIGDQAFAGCILLAAIDLPSSTNALGEDAFSFCSVLSSVRFRAVSCPALATGAFSGVADSGTVFIPYGADGYDAAWLAAHFPAGWQLVTLGGPEEEQATLTPGGTYWFDLSGVDIPGTRNGSLPDGSLRWSPFTYAGTVNAYVLNNASDGQPGAADDAANTTDPASTYGYRYDHSLFISEYNLSSDVSWRELNGAGLLFGKDYISGGAGYILRAPSVGNLSSGTGDHTRGLPLSNEWDSILAGGSTYIKNWTDVYSLGQDTTAQGYALRGYDASYGWNDTDSAGIDARPGYRPVLEALAPNTLKAIRLHLSGGTLAGADQIGNMDIVYAGDSFTAPSADGFARPAGKNGDYFKWRGNDGSLYAAGAAVPASVASLTAVWEDPEPSGSGGGGGGGGSSYCRRTLTDKPTGLTVSGEQIHVSAVLSVTTGTLHDAGEAGCDLLRAAEKAGRLLGVFDVSLSYGFRGKLSVSLPVANHDGQVLTVAHCLDGKLTLTDAKAANGLITVETDSLSPFAVLDGAYTKADLEQFLLPFTDVRESDWFHNAVLYVYINGLMNGTSATTFEPYGGSSRAMLATILYRMEGTPSILGEGRAFFTDILAGRWYTDAVTWCAANGLAKGYGNGRFGPDDPLTREQLVTLLYRYAAWKGWDTSAGAKTDLHSYPDAAQVSGWAVPAFQWACGAGIVEGMTDGRLAPKAGANRAELAQILARLLPKYASQPSG